MWIVWHGRVCIMMYDTKKRKYKFIPEKRWDRMSPLLRERYV